MNYTRFLLFCFHSFSKRNVFCLYQEKKSNILFFIVSKSLICMCAFVTSQWCFSPLHKRRTGSSPYSKVRCEDGYAVQDFIKHCKPEMWKKKIFHSNVLMFQMMETRQLPITALLIASYVSFSNLIYSLHHNQIRVQCMSGVAKVVPLQAKLYTTQTRDEIR